MSVNKRSAMNINCLNYWLDAIRIQILDSKDFVSLSTLSAVVCRTFCLFRFRVVPDKGNMML